MNGTEDTYIVTVHIIALAEHTKVHWDILQIVRNRLW